MEDIKNSKNRIYQWKKENISQRQNIMNEQKELIFNLYLKLLDKGYKEANWRASLFMFKEIGFSFDKQQFEAHLKKASNKNLIDGIFCLGFAFFLKNSKVYYTIFKKLSDQNHPLGKYIHGFFLPFGHGFLHNQSEGFIQMVQAAGLHDSYVAQKVSKNFSIGFHGFPYDPEQAANYEKVAQECEISELGLFDPLPNF